MISFHNYSRNVGCMRCWSGKGKAQGGREQRKKLETSFLSPNYVSETFLSSSIFDKLITFF